VSFGRQRRLVQFSLLSESLKANLHFQVFGGGRGIPSKRLGVVRLNKAFSIEDTEEEESLEEAQRTSLLPSLLHRRLSPATKLQETQIFSTGVLLYERRSSIESSYS